MENQHKKSGIIYPIGAYVLWGILPIYWKLMKQLPAGDILAHRIFWSFIFLAIIITITRKWSNFKQGFKSKRTVLAVMLASILISANWLIYIWAVNSNHIVEASLGYYINPLVTILLGRIVLHEKADKWQTTSIIIALVGVAYLAYQFGSIPWVALSLALSFAFYGLVKKMSSLAPLNGLAAETLMVAPLALFYLFQFGNAASYENLPITTYLLILMTGIVTSIPLLLFAKGTKCVSLTTIGFVQYLSPSISLLIGVFIYNEPFTHAHQVSFTLIWIALAIYTLTRNEVAVRTKPALVWIKQSIFSGKR